MLSLRSSASLFKASRNFGQCVKNPPTIRWTAFYPVELQYLKYLKQKTIFDNYATDINITLLNQDFGQHTFDDFFGEHTTVDLPRLFSKSYEDLNEVEKRQRSAMKKELDYTISFLNLRLDIGKAIHERNVDQLKYLIQNGSYSYGIKAWIDAFLSNPNLYDYIDRLPPVLANEITFISDHEFAHYPFLSPFKFKNLCRITEGIREKLEEMPHNFAGILGSIPVALTEEEASAMGIVIDYNKTGKHPLYLINISIVVTGAGVVAFVPKLVSSDIDIRYPVIKHVMHDGNVYRNRALTEPEGQVSLQNIQNSVPNLESRHGLYQHYTYLPLVNLMSADSRITKIKIGDNVVHIIPEICLEHEKGLAVKLWAEKQKLFKDKAFTQEEAIYIFHVLIASGSPIIKSTNMVGDMIFVHDRKPGSSFISDKKGVEINPACLSMNNDRVGLVMFEPLTLTRDARPIDDNQAKFSS